MGFVTPLFFWVGLGLIGIPVILHLIFRQRGKTVVFPALRLLQQRYEVRKRRLRLQHLLLLLLRALVLFLLGMALARPTINFGEGLPSEEAPVAAVLIFDTSPRMAYRFQNQTRLQAAQSLGLWLLRELPRDSDIAVLETRPMPPRFAVDRGAAKTQIERLQFSALTESIPKALEKAISLLETSDKPHREVYFFTDLTTSAWPEESLGALRERLKAARGISYYIFDVGIQNPADSGIVHAQLASEVMVDAMPASFEIQCRRWGPAETRALVGYLSGPLGKAESNAQTEPVKRVQETVEFAQNGTATLNVRIGGLTQGVYQGYFQLEGDSPLGVNDRWYFTIQVRPAFRVLIAAPQPAGQHAVYLSQALAPETLRRAGISRYQCDVVSYEELQKQDLATYAAYFLLDPPPLPDSFWMKLRDLVRTGKGVALFLGRSLGSIEKWNAGPVQDLLAGQILVQARDPGGELHLRPSLYDHYLLTPFRSVAGSVPWDMFPVYRYWVLDPLASDAYVIVPLSNGHPAIVERSVQKGRAITVATAISDLPEESPWSMLTMGQAWPFVILANQMALYLAGAGDLRSNYFVGEPVRLELDPELRLTSVLLEPPPDVLNSDTKEATLPVRVNVDPESHEILISATDQIGNFRVVAREAGVDFHSGFSVNCPGHIMNLDRVSAGLLEQTFADVPMQIARDKEHLLRQVTAGRTGLEITPYLLGLLALIMALEQVLANRFYRSSPAAPSTQSKTAPA